jgi:hypothetical protein
MIDRSPSEFDPAALIEVGRIEAAISQLSRRKAAILTNVERRDRVLTPEQRIASAHLRASRRFGRDLRREWRLSGFGRLLMKILVDVRKSYRRRGGDITDGFNVVLKSLATILGRRERRKAYSVRQVIRGLDELWSLNYLRREQERKPKYGRLRIWIPGLDLLERLEAAGST